MNRKSKKKAGTKKRNRERMAPRRAVVLQLPGWVSEFMGTIAARCGVPIETVVLVLVTAKICALEKQG